jgi:hypothetical protein
LKSEDNNDDDGSEAKSTLSDEVWEDNDDDGESTAVGFADEELFDDFASDPPPARPPPLLRREREWVDDGDDTSLGVLSFSSNRTAFDRSAFPLLFCVLFVVVPRAATSPGLNIA